MDDGVSNVMRMAGVTLNEAISMATRNPARVGESPAGSEESRREIARIWCCLSLTRTQRRSGCWRRSSGVGPCSKQHDGSSVLTVGGYDTFVDKLYAVAIRIGKALEAAGLQYKIVGGFAVFIHVKAVEPVAARVTRDVDIAVRRSDLQTIITAAEQRGFRYRHAAGLDMLLDGESGKAKDAVHLIFVGERVHATDPEPVPEGQPVTTEEGVYIASVADLVRMKLTSFRLKDKVHVQDLDEVGLITTDVEAALPPVLKERLDQVRATE